MSLQLLQGDALHLPLDDTSINCTVTSPPYFGLRVYRGLAPTLWPGGMFVTYPGAEPVRMPAWTGCLGNEDTVELYLWHSVLWLREVRRVLHEDGAAWVVLGDSYANIPGNGRGGETVEGGMPHRSARPRTTMPPGNLLLIPARVALAAQADGWVVRQELIWEKVAAMPESVQGWQWQHHRCACLNRENLLGRGTQKTTNNPDRQDNFGPHGVDIRDRLYGQPDPTCSTCGGTGCLDETVLRKGSWRHTRATESIFQLTKGMGYFANGVAVEEPAVATKPRGGFKQGQSLVAYPRAKNDGFGERYVPRGTRNPRNVVRPHPHAFAGDHFACFPPALVEPLLRATCPARVCTQCRAPWAPAVLDTGEVETSANGSRFDRGKTAHHGHVQAGLRTRKQAKGLAPTCRCETSWQPGVCLDPFAGSGTTLLVARQLGLHAIGVERSTAYLPLARERLGLTALEAWQTGEAPRQESFADLPLFG